MSVRSGTQAYRCIGGPLHGQTIQTDQYDYVAPVPRRPAPTFDQDDFAPTVEKAVRYRLERFVSRTHDSALHVMLAEGVNKNGIETLRLMLDAFMPEMIAATTGRS